LRRELIKKIDAIRKAAAGSYTVYLHHYNELIIDSVIIKSLPRRSFPIFRDVIILTGFDVGSSALLILRPSRQPTKQGLQEAGTATNRCRQP
jgi:hypothetical protein